MCGRFTLRVLPEYLQDRFGARFKSKGYKPSYNIAPGKAIPIIPNDRPDEIIWMRWGMEPFWWKQKGRFLINIRMESLKEKKVFSKMFKEQRCLIPADGFFEWKKVGSKKRPFYFKFKDDSVFSFAGLFDREKNGLTCAIATCEPNSLVKKVHDRMPCILNKEDEPIWLGASADEVDLAKLLKPINADQLEAYEVGLAVNSPTNDEERLIERA